MPPNQVQAPLQLSDDQRFSLMKVIHNTYHRMWLSFDAWCILFLVVMLNSHSAHSAAPECRSRGEGRLIGQLKSRDHGVQGTVHAVDKSTLFINNFSYDGEGPDAFFWIGSDPEPSDNGEILPYPEGFDGKLMKYDGSAVLLELPKGKLLTDIRWLAVWCRAAKVSYGEVMFPKDLVPPRPRVLPEFKRLAHMLRSGNITILDGKTFHIPRLHYDGKGPNAFFLVGSGTEPNGAGTKVPDETGSLNVLHRYSGQDITIQLPGHLTACDIDWLAMYCIKYKHNFGHVFIPKDLDVPPALGQHGHNERAISSASSHLRKTSSILNVILIFLPLSFE